MLVLKNASFLCIFTLNTGTTERALKIEFSRIKIQYKGRTFEYKSAFEFETEIAFQLCSCREKCAGDFSIILTVDFVPVCAF